ATHADPPTLWEPGVSFTCEATLTVDGAADQAHHNTATVVATPASGGAPVTDDDDYHAFAGQIGVIKWDGNEPGPADGSDDAKALLDAAVDADTADDAAVYP